MSKEKKLSKEKLDSWNWTFYKLAQKHIVDEKKEEANQAYNQIRGSIIESSAQEPSEAELREFIEKWTKMMSVAFYESNIMHSIKLMLKEYNQLCKRRGE